MSRAPATPGVAQRWSARDRLPSRQTQVLSAALAKSLTTLTEAKTATLADLGIVSPVSCALAAGTGTDATAVFCARGGAPLHDTGKHTAFGEMAARLVTDTLGDAIAHDRDWAGACG